MNHVCRPAHVNQYGRILSLLKHLYKELSTGPAKTACAPCICGTSSGFMQKSDIPCSHEMLGQTDRVVSAGMLGLSPA